MWPWCLSTWSVEAFAHASTAQLVKSLQSSNPMLALIKDRFVLNTILILLLVVALYQIGAEGIRLKRHTDALETIA